MPPVTGTPVRGLRYAQRASGELRVVLDLDGAEGLGERLHGLLTTTQIKAVKKRMELVLEEAEIVGETPPDESDEAPAEASEQSALPAPRVPRRAA